VRAWTALIEIIFSRAEKLVQQGRSQTLFQWLDALPSQVWEKSPWLCYWRGTCLLATNPPQALQEITRAFELFEDEGDAAGSMLTWGMVVNAIVIAWDDYVVLDQWIERFDRLLARYRDYPSKAIESLMVQGICKSLAWRYPERRDLPIWAERLHQLVTGSNDSDFRLLAGSNLVLYHLVSGSVATAKSLVEVLNSDLYSATVSPLKKLVWLVTRASLEWLLLDRDGCLATIEAGRSLIESSGVHVLDLRLYGQGITLGLTTGDLSLVRRLFAELPANPINTAMDHAHHALLQADLSLLEGDTAKAVALAETADQRAIDSGNTVVRGMCLCVFTMALYQDGQFERAANVLEKGLALTQGMSFFRSCLLLQAAFYALEKEQGVESALPLLREGFGLAAHHGYFNFLPWRDEIMSKLCQEALAAEIEVEYVARLTERHKLTNVQSSPQLLSPKEMETLGWVKEGKTTWEIATIQGVSEATVKFHVGNILRKFGVNSRTQAVAVALEAGLLKE
jgi:DNA-binding CsgD family transcriptional regulator